ncbi:MAG: TIGR03943 family putative permease subunit [Sporichthyaceae bacterium]
MIASAQMIILVMVGATMLRSTLDGTYLYYVKPSLAPFLLVAALAFLVLGLIQAFWLLVPSKRPGRLGTPSCAETHQHGEGEVDEHGAAHVPRVAWLLALPVLVMMVVAPAPLGSFAADRESGVVAEPDSYDFPPLPPADPAPITLTEYGWRSLYDEGETLAGRNVELSGFVTPRGKGEWFLTRMSLSCCAADGRAIKVVITGATAPPRDTWVIVTGRHAQPTSTDRRSGLPVLAASDVREISAPARPYE